MTRVGVLIFLIASAVLPTWAGEKPPRPRLCPEDAPEGVRLPPQPGCGNADAPPARRDGGFHDLGNGMGLRIGGRAGAVFDGRH